MSIQRWMFKKGKNAGLYLNIFSTYSAKSNRIYSASKLFVNHNEDDDDDSNMNGHKYAFHT